MVDKERLLQTIRQFEQLDGNSLVEAIRVNELEHLLGEFGEGHDYSLIRSMDRDALQTLIELVVDLEVGDIILAGKWKNKREVVKSLGTDDLGQPTVNGKSLLTVRIEKTLPDDKKSKKTREEEAAEED